MSELFTITINGKDFESTNIRTTKKLKRLKTAIYLYLDEKMEPNDVAKALGVPTKALRLQLASIGFKKFVQRNRVITDEDIRSCIERHQQGEIIMTMAKELETSDTTVKVKMRRLGYSINDKAYVAEEEAGAAVNLSNIWNSILCSSKLRYEMA